VGIQTNAVASELCFAGQANIHGRGADEDFEFSGPSDPYGKAVGEVELFRSEQQVTIFKKGIRKVKAERKERLDPFLIVIPIADDRALAVARFARAARF
jgi:hypothetical protein